MAAFAYDHTEFAFVSRPVAKAKKAAESFLPEAARQKTA